MATGSRFSFADMQNPLFFHPSDGPTSICVPKLQGASNYRAWHRSMEIQLASKRKLGFVDGSVKKSAIDATEAAQWETCNNMIISWLHSNITDAVKRSVLFINLASEVWKQLEKRFMLTNGSRKYKLNKYLFSLKQNELSVADYYTSMSSLWKKIESMKVLPTVSTVNEEITALLKAIETIKEEVRLFQFLNDFNEVYGAQRIELLMLSPLPTVEVACAAFQQEESQREALNVSAETEVAAMYSLGYVEKRTGTPCTACGVKGHLSSKCWTIHGYPKWHYKHNRNNSKANGSGKKWSGDKIKMVNAAQSSGGEQGVVFSLQQLQQFLAMMPGTVS
ncbi:uncharacterized protein LOC141713026 [Apium graveolens]|uniref:uncharacterized protein LOC141713026 n=1 Tax=Apium graveolens TaxID=4045 RepID=UPI003D7B63AF